jgi:cephalosporin hydroxylase
MNIVNFPTMTQGLAIQAAQITHAWQETSVLDLWHRQTIQHHRESYRGIGLAKFPQDLWSYEKLIDLSQPEVIIEIGINEGGFTRWLHDRLLLAQSFNPSSQPRTVIGIDIDIDKPKQNLAGLLNNPVGGVNLQLFQCNLLSTKSLRDAKAQVVDIVGDRSLLIIEDSGHSYDTTKASLDTFSPLLKSGEWLVVEDTCVDIEALREIPSWPRGALSATNDFLISNDAFERTNFNHTYEITCHPYGFLRKK